MLFSFRHCVINFFNYSFLKLVFHNLVILCHKIMFISYSFTHEFNLPYACSLFTDKGKFSSRHGQVTLYLLSLKAKVFWKFDIAFLSECEA
jgi:hypothetical protein